MSSNVQSVLIVIFQLDGENELVKIQLLGNRFFALEAKNKQVKT